jgi:hypothetical protein
MRKAVRQNTKSSDEDTARILPLSRVSQRRVESTSQIIHSTQSLDELIADSVRSAATISVLKFTGGAAKFQDRGR